jgi:Prp8 binding protein
MSLVKRPRSDRNRDTGSLVVGPSTGSIAITQTSVPRTSGLNAPNIQLTGHEAEVLTVGFDISGQFLASGSADKSILLWNVYGENENYGIITGHKGAVLDLKWSRDSRQLFTSSSDLTVGVWDIQSGSRIRKHLGHEDMVNSIDVVRRGVELLVSGSDDGSVGIWDPREKEAVTHFQTDNPILAVAFDSVGSQVFSGGVEGTISVWDSRKTNSPLYFLAGHHENLVTSLNVSPDDQQLLSNGMDGTVRTWDIKAFAPDNRALKVYDGAPAGIEQNLLRAKWNKDGTKIAAGSADRTVVVWDTFSRRILYKLPGHIGSVNDVSFSSIEPILASGSSDRTVLLGEIT